MRITTVRYARLKNLGNYENERVELEAELGPDEPAAEVLDDLRVEADLWLYPPVRMPVASDDDEVPF